jgi:hypothetical protein
MYEFETTFSERSTEDSPRLTSRTPGAATVETSWVLGDGGGGGGGTEPPLLIGW